MKKFFNDHVGLMFVLALCAAGAALYLGIKARKDNKSQEDKLVVLAESLEPLQKALAEANKE